MGIDFYYAPISGPCRSILVLAKHLGIEMNLIKMDLIVAKDQLKPEFVALNPQHCIPTMVDNGFVLWESRAILEYLVQKYGNGKLYPSDLQQRAVVSQRLYFDACTLFQRFIDYYYPQWMLKLPADAEKQKKVEEALNFLDIFLTKSEYVAGNEPTIADITIGVTVGNFDVLGFDLAPYKNVEKWFKKVNEIPGFEINEQGRHEFKKVIDEFLNKK